MASSNPLQRGSRGCGMFIHRNHAAGGGNDSIMVGMFVGLCLASQSPSEREFFVPARTDLGVKLLTNLTEYFVGTEKLACYCLNTRLQLCVFTNNLLKYLSNRTTKKLLKCYISEFFGPPRLAPRPLLTSGQPFFWFLVVE
jgi:hypothetical protein